jgi:hypothetical protein
VTWVAWASWIPAIPFCTSWLQFKTDFDRLVFGVFLITNQRQFLLSASSLKRIYPYTHKLDDIIPTGPRISSSCSFVPLTMDGSREIEVSHRNDVHIPSVVTDHLTIRHNTNVYINNLVSGKNNTNSVINAEADADHNSNAMRMNNRAVDVERTQNALPQNVTPQYARRHANGPGPQPTIQPNRHLNIQPSPHLLRPPRYFYRIQHRLSPTIRHHNGSLESGIRSLGWDPHGHLGGTWLNSMRVEHHLG